MVNNKNEQTVNKNGRQGGIGKRKGKRLWIIVLLLVIGGATVVFSGLMRTPLSTSAGGMTGTFTVREDDLVITVTESVNIKAQESTDIICEVEGRGVEIASGLQVGEKVPLSPPQGMEREPASEEKQPQDNAEQSGETIEKPIPDTST